MYHFNASISFSRRRLSLMLVLALGLALLAAGCGDSDGDTTALTKAVFIKKGDAICTRADRLQQQALAKASAEQQGLKAASFAKRAKHLLMTASLPQIQEEAEALRALGAPSRDEEEIEAIVDGIEETVERVKENPVPWITQAEYPFEEVDQLARKYGFKVCSETT